jgi:hypothetical protein
MSLTGEDAEGLIEDKIMDSMSGKFKGDGAEKESKKWLSQQRCAQALSRNFWVVSMI